MAVTDRYSLIADNSFAFAAPGVLANDVIASGNTLSVVSSTQPSGGSATVRADGSLLYTPRAGFSGPDAFTYTIRDTAGATATGTVNVTVVPCTGEALSRPARGCSASTRSRGRC